MYLRRIIRNVRPTALFVVAIMLLSFAARAEFVLNFMPKGLGVMSTEIAHEGCGTGLVGGQTAFLIQGGCAVEGPEIVTDPDTGLDYYHMIVGDPADGFMQESFIEVGSVPGLIDFSTALAGDNGHDPLGVIIGLGSGNALANPRKIIMRQIINDGEIMMEFLKDEYLKKPLISQMLITSELSSLFHLDMRNSTYEDMNSPANLINIFSLNDSFLQGMGDFDMATDVDNAFINGGRYTYSDGVGPGGSEGSYLYLDGGFDERAVHWADYIDPTEDNPWAYPELRPN